MPGITQFPTVDNLTDLKAQEASLDHLSGVLGFEVSSGLPFSKAGHFLIFSLEASLPLAILIEAPNNIGPSITGVL